MANENGQEKRDTMADIVSEMRHGLDKSWHDIDREWARGLPDRIEAAWKRELAEFERKCTEAVTIAATQGLLLTKEKYEKSPCGNAAAMYDALDVSDRTCNLRTDDV